MSTRVSSSVRWLAALCALGVARAGHAQELLVNGGFATGTLAGWTFTPDIGAEPSLNPTVVPFMGSDAFRLNTGSATSGVEAGGTLSQTILLSAGVTYQVSASKLAIVVNNGSPNADGGTITVAVGGNVLHVFDLMSIPAAPPVNLDSFSVPFSPGVSGPAAFTVKFSRSFPNFSPNALFHYVDDLSVLTTIPEPSAGVLCALGGVAVAWRRRAGR